MIHGQYSIDLDYKARIVKVPLFVDLRTSYLSPTASSVECVENHPCDIEVKSKI